MKEYAQSLQEYAAYALTIIHEELLKRGSELVVGPEAGTGFGFDALAPKGWGDLPGPTAIEVVGRPFSTVREFRDTLNRLANSTCNSLLMVSYSEDAPISAQKADLVREANTGYPLRFGVLYPRDVDELAKSHPKQAAAFRGDFLPQAVEVLANEPAADDRVKESHLESLRRALAEDNLVLFLGAGCSQSANLPGWDELLSRLSHQLLLRHTSTTALSATPSEVVKFLKDEAPESPLIAARFFRESFGDDFAHVVRTALYQGLSKKTPTSELLKAIARLCIPPRNGVGVSAVVTYNYDDLVESALNSRGVIYQAIVDEGDTVSRRTLPIYHVHGFLPRRGELTDVHRRSLVLSEEAYHQQFKDPYAWQTVTQLNLLRDKVCLFLGFSMTDPNQRRLLDIAREKRPSMRHYVVLKDHWGAAADKDDSGRLKPYARVFKGLEEASLLKLGLHVIWVPSHDAIPSLIRSIKDPQLQQNKETPATAAAAVQGES